MSSGRHPIRAVLRILFALPAPVAYLLASLLLLGGEVVDPPVAQAASGAAAGASGAGHAAAAGASSPASALAPRLERVRGQIANGWWSEARGEVKALLATPEGRSSPEVWLLEAEIAYQTLDVRGAYRALEEASSLAEPSERTQIDGLLDLLNSRLGILELRLARLAPIRLELQVPLLDPHLAALFERGRAALAAVGSEAPGTPGDPVVIEWFDPASEPVTRSLAGPVGARLYLPAGQYRVSDIPIEIVASRATTFALQQSAGRRRGRVSLSAGYLQTGSPGASVGPLESIASLEVALTGKWIGGRALLGTWLSTVPAEVTSAGDVAFAAVRPALRGGVFVPIDLTANLRLEPGLNAMGLILPYQRFDCTASAVGGDGGTTLDICYDDVWAFGGSVGLRLGAHAGTGAGWLVQIETEIGGQYLEALHSSWTEGEYRVALEQPWMTRTMWTAGLRAGWIF